MDERRQPGLCDRQGPGIISPGFKHGPSHSREWKVARPLESLAHCGHFQSRGWYCTNIDVNESLEQLILEQRWRMGHIDSIHLSPLQFSHLNHSPRIVSGIGDVCIVCPPSISALLPSSRRPHHLPPPSTRDSSTPTL
jgi:hypothetical protein